MAPSTRWTRQQLLVAFTLYCRLPFGRLHHRNPEIVRYASLLGQSPSALAMKLTNIASLDPEITSSGRSGLKAASSADRAMWEEMHGDWEAFAVDAKKAMAELEDGAPGLLDLEEPIDYIGQDLEILTTARIGQSFFRAAVLGAYNERCCITGLSLPRLLIASHIVPWRDDELNRVNPRNGLLLSTLHDKAFDAGIITINEDMQVQVSPAYSGNKDTFYSATIEAFDGKPIRLPEKFSPDAEFLAYHREQVFQG